jgi:lipoprotein-anchoring transpeptidase ErfK/SrfK
MNIIRKSALGSASALIAASLGLWSGSAIAAPLAVSYLGGSAALVATTRQDRADVADSAALAPDPQRQDLVRKDLRRQVVDYVTVAAAGTIIIDTAHTYLYYVLGDGTAIRYGIGVGRDGFTWSGAQSVTRMAEWPDWTPPAEMFVRQPYLPRWMAGGAGNPLGARAIYLGSTVYRIHGTNAPATIGTKVSSGCIRLTNADVIDLYGRVTVGTRIVVLPNHGEVVAGTVAPVRIAAPRATAARTTGIY